MSTRFIPLEIPPGVFSKATKKMRSSNWAECNLIRWRENQLMPVGGQTQFPYTFASRCKRIHEWEDLEGTSHIAYLCEQNIYVDTGGILIDITPSSGLTPVAYSDGNYGEGIYAGDPSYGLTPPSYNTGVGGYGDGVYSGANYGTERAGSTIMPIDQLPDAFSLDNFGAILLAMTSPDGRLLYWDPASAPGTRASVVVPDSGRGLVPTGRCFVVTQERFVIVFGAYDSTNGGGPRRFAWCDQENFQAWDYSNVTSQAGFLDIEPAAPIVCAEASRTGVIFWTTKKSYASRFLGLPYIYNYVELADGTTPWSPQSVTTTSALTLWMSEQGLFAYDGTSILPVACLVRPWVDDDYDPVNIREQACAVHVGSYNEFWWFFPQLGSVYNTRAIIYNYKEGWWSQARMSRSAGITSSYTAYTIMADGLNAYQHEASTVHWGAEPPFAETFDLNINSGMRLITVKQLIPDVEGDISDLLYSLFYRNSRSLGLPELQSTPQPVRSDGYVDFRTTGRDIRLRIDIGDPPIVRPFTLGQHLIDVVPRGDR